MDAPTVAIGVVAIGLGAFCTLLGYRLALTLLPAWAFFVGFLTGARIEQALQADGFLVTPIGWVVGGAMGLALGALAYVFWYAAVAIAFGSVACWLAWGVMTLVGFPAVGPVAIGIGLLAGGVFAIVGLLTGVPLVALVFATAVGGAHALVAGVLLVLGTIQVGALGTGAVSAVIGAGIGWWLAAIGLSLISITLQLRTIGEFVLEPPAARL
jgi:hypothetical protein